MLQTQLESISLQEGEARRLALQQLAHSLEMQMAFEEVIPFLGGPAKLLRGVAVEVVRALGYPKNASILPMVVDGFEDINNPAQGQIELALNDLAAEVASAYVLQLLWKHAYEYGRETSDYGDVLVCLCDWLARKETKQACVEAIGPFLVATIDRWSQDQYLSDEVLNALERIGPLCANYALPGLLELAWKEQGSVLGKHVWRFIHSFEQETLARYHLILSKMHLYYSDGA